MGSLASRPKVPAASQVVYAPSPTPVVTSNTSTDMAPETDLAQEVAQTRKAGLLARERSRFGTVKTGFRGLLALTQNGAARKTLLGE